MLKLKSAQKMQRTRLKFLRIKIEPPYASDLKNLFDCFQLNLSNKHSVNVCFLGLRAWKKFLCGVRTLSIKIGYLWNEIIFSNAAHFFKIFFLGQTRHSKFVQDQCPDCMKSLKRLFGCKNTVNILAVIV